MTEDERESAEVDTLLRFLDHEPPAVTAADIAARGERRDGRWGRIAAGVLLALGLGGVAYALPGSPLPAWVHAAAGWAGSSGRPGAPPPAAPSLPSPGDEGGGIALDAADPVVVVLRSDGRGVLHVATGEDRRIVLRAPPGAARFTSEPGRLVVDVEAPDTLRLLVPPSARRVEVILDGRTLFLRADSATTAAVGMRPDGSYLLRLDGSS